MPRLVRANHIRISINSTLIVNNIIIHIGIYLIL